MGFDEMKVSTVLGTRPEIVRLSKIIPLLDGMLGASHGVFHSGQNYSPELDGDLFKEFGLRAPDVRVEAGGGAFAEQMAIFLPKLEAWLRDFRPDKFLVLGDTNSSVGALIAARLGVPVFHLEAGNRCHGPQSPEEVNRRVIDHVSTVHLCYSERARMNLVAEGLPLARTYVVGNPLAEVLAGYFSVSNRSVMEPEPWMRSTWSPYLGSPGILATLHRAENVDDPERLGAFLDAINDLCVHLGTKCVLSTHPRTRARLKAIGVRNARDEASYRRRIVDVDPLPFGKFVALEATAKLVLSDSGTAPEECAMLGRPLVVLRDYMERQEVMERGGAVLWAPGSSLPLRVAAEAACSGDRGFNKTPPDYTSRPTADAVVRILLSPVPPA